MATFEKALKAVLVHEGGYANHPRDPGGPTMKGVTQRTYDAFRKARGLEKLSVAHITEIEISAIYRQGYWAAVRGDSLPAGVSYVLFDGAVNSGPSRSIKWLQQALKLNQIDGVLGDGTLAAVRAHPDHDLLIRDIIARREAFLRRLSTFDAFGKGWMRRIADVQRRGQAWATGSVGADPVYLPGMERKARDEEAKKRPTTAPADAAIGGGAATGGVSGTLGQVKEQLEPLAGTSEWIGTVVAVLAIAGAAIAIGGIAWRWYQARRQAEHDEALA